MATTSLLSAIARPELDMPHSPPTKRSPAASPARSASSSRPASALEPLAFSDATSRGPRQVPTPSFGHGSRFQYKPVSYETQQRPPSCLGTQPDSTHRSAPRPVFGSSTRADWAKAAAAPRGGAVGPGSFQVPGALGVQSHSERRTAPALSFGGTTQRNRATSAAQSPGPIYRVPSGIVSNRGYSFGAAARQLPTAGRVSSPGPIYALQSSVGTTGPAFSFGKRNVLEEIERAKRKRATSASLKAGSATSPLRRATSAAAAPRGGGRQPTGTEHV